MELRTGVFTLLYFTLLHFTLLHFTLVAHQPSTRFVRAIEASGAARASSHWLALKAFHFVRPPLSLGAPAAPKSLGERNVAMDIRSSSRRTLATFRRGQPRNSMQTHARTRARGPKRKRRWLERTRKKKMERAPPWRFFWQEANHLV